MPNMSVSVDATSFPGCWYEGELLYVEGVAGENEQRWRVVKVESYVP